MKETHDFLVPNYFPAFSCKMGKCRAACCQGWPISITMRNYFSLLSINCRKALRERLDCALHLVDHPTEDEYARFSPRYDGDCPMRMADGRCSLHAELGEDVLPDICRLYPRGIRSESGYECSCAGSCEAVLELLIHQKEPISFHTERLTFKMPHTPKRMAYFETMGREREIRLFFIRTVQNRAFSLPRRLMNLGEVLIRMDDALNKKDGEAVEKLLTAQENNTAETENRLDKTHLQDGLAVAEKMLALLDERSESIRQCGEEALRYFCPNGETGPNDAFTRYEAAKRHFETLFPDWEIFFEHMLVNHMFFSQFPFQDRPESLNNEFIALCAVYALLRFLAVGWMADKTAESDFIDAAAAVFRLIDHTEFDRYASRLLRMLGCAEKSALFSLISL